MKALLKTYLVMHYLFFRKNLTDLPESGENLIIDITKKYRPEIFRPSWFRIKPHGAKRIQPFFTWWLLYFTIWIWRSKRYEFHLLYDGERLINYCGVLPKYYRYPFMKADDIQIGPFWTADEYRRQGICSTIIRKIMSEHKAPSRYAYIITQESNTESQKCITKSGLSLYGYGIRSKGLFGKFHLT